MELPLRILGRYLYRYPLVKLHILLLLQLHTEANHRVRYTESHFPHFLALLRLSCPLFHKRLVGAGITDKEFTVFEELARNGRWLIMSVNVKKMVVLGKNISLLRIARIRRLLHIIRSRKGGQIPFVIRVILK